MLQSLFRRDALLGIEDETLMDEVCKPEYPLEFGILGGISVGKGGEM